MEPHRVLQETAYPSLAYGLFGLGRFLPQILDSYVIERVGPRDKMIYPRQ